MISSTDGVKNLNTCVLNMYVLSVVCSVQVHGSFNGFGDWTSFIFESCS